MSTGLPPSGEYLGGQTIGGTSRSTPIAFSVPGGAGGLFVSIWACLAHMYMEKDKVGHISPCSSVFFFVVLNSSTIFIQSTVIFGCLVPQPPLFFTGSSVSCSCSRSSPWSKPFCSCKHLAREVDDPGPRGRGLYIGNTASLIRASEYLQTLHVTLEYVSKCCEC